MITVFQRWSREASFGDMLDVLGNFIHTSSFSSFAFCSHALGHYRQARRCLPTTDKHPLCAPCRIKHLLFKNSYTEWHPFYLFECSIVCFVWFFFLTVADFCYERAMLTVMWSEVLDRLFYWVKYRRGYCRRTDFVDYFSLGTSNMKQECNLPGKKRFKAVTKLIILAFTLSSESSGRNKKERGQREKTVISDERLILLCRLDVEYF